MAKRSKRKRRGHFEQQVKSKPPTTGEYRREAAEVLRRDQPNPPVVVR
jgi:hypothetical protein